jgi:hypothetical protein
MLAGPALNLANIGYCSLVKQAFHEKCCGSIGHLMHFNASFGHKKSIPNGEAEKTGNPRSKVAGFFMMRPSSRASVTGRCSCMTHPTKGLKSVVGRN